MDTKFKKVVSILLLGTMFTYTLPVLAYTKEESVYSKLDANGKTYQTIVSDHLKNTEKESVLQDLSDLMNIENVSGDQELKQENNTLTWKAEGEDIYYEGETEKQLPIECQVTYELDGEETSKEEIVGKSGNVKITLHFTNHEQREVTINGRRQTMYVPFVVGVGTILDNENNKNIEITNGKVIDDGTKTMVAGIAMPGMQENLAISESQFEIPESVEISMEAKDFESNAIYIFATPKVLEEKDLDVFDKLDGLYAKMNTLSSSMNQIEEGANTLKEGTNTYYEKSQEFNNAVGQIAGGASTLNKSYKDLDDGINNLDKSSGKLNSGAKDLNAGATAISDSLQTVNESVKKLAQGGTGIAQGEKNLTAGLDKIIGSVSQVTAVDNSSKIGQLEQLLETNNATIQKLTAGNTSLQATLTQLKLLPETDEIKAQKTNIETQITTNSSIITLLKTNNGAMEQTIATLEATDLTQMKALEDGLTSLKEGLGTLQAGTKDLNDGLAKLQAGTNTLATESKKLTAGSKELYAGTQALQAGTNQLSSGSTQIKAGINTLNSGSSQLQEASTSLTQGAGTINDGTETLTDGITQFNKDGIQVLYNTINGQVKDLQVRIEKMQQLANEYKTFTMAEENTEGNVKFIMMIDSLKKEDIAKEQVILPDNEKKEE